MSKVLCPNCGLPMVVDEPGGSAYWSMPTPYSPSPGGSALLVQTGRTVPPYWQSAPLPSPAVPLPNAGKRVVMHVPPCPEPSGAGGA